MDMELSKQDKDELTKLIKEYYKPEEAEDEEEAKEKNPHGAPVIDFDLQLSEQASGTESAVDRIVKTIQRAATDMGVENLALNVNVYVKDTKKRLDSYVYKNPGPLPPPV